MQRTDFARKMRQRMETTNGHRPAPNTPAATGGLGSWAGALIGRLPLMRRAVLVESLDQPGQPLPELDRNLADFGVLNLLPGGTSASMRAIRRLLPDARDDVTVLDVGAGGADMALAFARQRWRTIALDSHPAVLSRARDAVAVEPLIDVMAADARSMPLADGAVDVAHCSLLIHHLDPPDAVAVLREMARVARHGVVVNDLRRGLLSFVATGVTLAVAARARVTRVDGLISARRAYSLDELDQLLAQAGLARVWRSNVLLPRVVTAVAAAE